MRYETKRVYSTKVATELIKKGYTLLRVEQNPYNRNFPRYIFQWTETIEEEMRKA